MIDKTHARLAVLFSDVELSIEEVIKLAEQSGIDGLTRGVFASCMMTAQHILQFTLDNPAEARQLLDLIKSRQPDEARQASSAAADNLYNLGGFSFKLNDFSEYVQILMKEFG